MIRLSRSTLLAAIAVMVISAAASDVTAQQPVLQQPAAPLAMPSPTVAPSWAPAPTYSGWSTPYSATSSSYYPGYGYGFGSGNLPPRACYGPAVSPLEFPYPRYAGYPVR